MARVAVGVLSRSAAVSVEREFLVCLAGNPNVGKSTLFNHLTKSSVDTANYPGMTVELNTASADWLGHSIRLVDIPGTYSLDPVSEDQAVARRALLELRPGLTLVILDATNLVRDLYLVLGLLDLSFSVVVGLNLMDEARRLKLLIDSHKLSELLGASVVQIVARNGEGVRDLVEAVATELGGLADGTGPQTRVIGQARESTAAIAERHSRARAISESVTEDHQVVQNDRLWGWMTSLYTGIPILLGVLVAIFAILFYVGGLLSTLLTNGWNASLGPAITTGAVFGTGVLGGTILWGFNGGILAVLGVAISVHPRLLPDPRRAGGLGLHERRSLSD